MPKKEKDGELKFTVKQTKDFITLIIGTDKAETPKKQEKDGKLISTLIHLLTDKTNKVLKEHALQELKSEAGKEILLKAIAVTESIETRKVLVAACWEAGLDFCKYVSFFVKLAIISDLEICLDALTIIEDMQGPFDKKLLADCIAQLNDAKKNTTLQKSTLLADIIANLERHLEYHNSIN